jgi:ABC-type transport system substrate-binding protein
MKTIITFTLLFLLAFSIGIAPQKSQAQNPISSPQSGYGVPMANSPTFEGILNIIWGDPYPKLGSGGPTQYTLTLLNGTNVALQLAGKESYAENYFLKRVVVSGRAVPNQYATTHTYARSSIVVDTIAPSQTQLGGQATTAAGVFGTRRVIYLLLKFSDDSAVPHPPVFYTDLNNPDTPPVGEVFPATVNGFFRKTSWNQFYWVGDVGGMGGVGASGGWLTLPHPKSYYAPCGWSGACADVWAIGDDGTALGREQGIIFTNYDNINFVLSNDLDCCAWGGSYYSGADNKWYGSTWEPPWGQEAGTYSHEMGHSLGLPHSGWVYYAYDSPWDLMSARMSANTVYCGSYSSDNSGGTASLYCTEPGDGYIAAYKDYLGWIPSANEVLTSTGSALTVTLEGDALPLGTATKMLKICITGSPCTGPTAHYFTVEARVRGYQFDNGIPGEGVIIHMFEGDRPTVGGPCFFNSQSGWAWPIDGTPGDYNSATCSFADGAALFNAQWVPGQIYFNATYGLSIKVVSRTGSSFVVTVNGAPRLFYVTLIVPTSNAVRLQYAKDITNNMIAAGITASLVPMDFSLLSNRLFFNGVAQGATYDQGGYDIGFIGWGYTSALPDFSTVASGSFAPAGVNYALYSNPQVDSMISSFYHSADQQTQIQIARSVEEALFHDAPYNYIYEPDNVVASKPSWTAWGSSSLFNGATFPDIQHWAGPTSLAFAEAAPVFPSGNLDPAITPPANTLYASYIYNAIMGGALQEFDARDNSLIPGTVQSISPSPDNRTWTVTIKPGVFFQDGVEVTADDFVYTQYIMTNPGIGSINLQSNIFALGNYATFTFLNGTSRVDDNSAGGPRTVGSWTSTGKYAFQFTLPAAYALTRQVYCAFAPLPMHILEQYPLSQSQWDNAPFSQALPHTYIWNTGKYGGSGSYSAVGPVGAGPYILQSFDKVNGVATLTKFTNYWNKTGLESLGQFSISTYTVKYVQGRNSAMTELGSGQVNFLDPNYGLAANQTYLQSIGATVVLSPGLGWQEMGFNLRHPIFGTGLGTPLGRSNPSMAAEAARHVRKAISHLIPRNYIVSQYSYGAGYPLASSFGPGWGIWYDSSLQPDSYDMNAALVELAAAGYGGLSSAITLGASSPAISLGSSVTLSGGITPTQPAGTMVTISYSLDSGATWNSFITTQTDGTGSYSSTWIPPHPGAYQLRSSWGGNAGYVGATSPTAYLTVTGTPSPQITVLVAGPSSTPRGGSATFDVLVTNPGTSVIATLYLEVTGPGGYEYFDTLQVSIAGSASSRFLFAWQVPSSASTGNYQITVGLIPPRPATFTQTQISVT